MTLETFRNLTIELYRSGSDDNVLDQEFVLLHDMPLTCIVDIVTYRTSVTRIVFSRETSTNAPLRWHVLIYLVLRPSKYQSKLAKK